MEAKEREALLNKIEHQRRCVDEALKAAVATIKREAFLVSITKRQEKFDELLADAEKAMSELVNIADGIKESADHIKVQLAEVAS